MLRTLPSLDLARRLSLLRLNAGFEDKGVLEGASVAYAGLGLAGYQGNSRPGRVILLGPSEFGYLASLSEAAARGAMAALFTQRVACLIVATEDEVPGYVLQEATLAEVAVYRSPFPPASVQPTVTEALRDWLAPVETMHGVMVDVSGMGVLILGESGIGKSECALELIRHGHRLVADDAVRVKRISDGVAVAEAPDGFRHAMELRGIGLIDVRSLFGMEAICDRKQIELVVRFELPSPERRYERLGIEQQATRICGVELPYLVIPIREGKNMAILVEVAAKNQHLRNLGINSAEEIAKSLERRIEQKSRQE